MLAPRVHAGALKVCWDVANSYELKQLFQYNNMSDVCLKRVWIHNLLCVYIIHPPSWHSRQQ